MIFWAGVPLLLPSGIESSALAPPFWPETSEIALPGGELAATAVSSSNYANPKFTYKGLSEVARTGNHSLVLDVSVCSVPLRLR